MRTMTAVALVKGSSMKQSWPIERKSDKAILFCMLKDPEDKANLEGAEFYWVRGIGDAEKAEIAPVPTANDKYYAWRLSEDADWQDVSFNNLHMPLEMNVY